MCKKFFFWISRKEEEVRGKIKTNQARGTFIYGYVRDDESPLRSIMCLSSFALGILLL